MTWNYRIIKHDTEKEVWYAIHEVYYKNGKIECYSMDPIEPSGYSKKECINSIELMLKDAKTKKTLSLKNLIKRN